MLMNRTKAPKKVKRYLKEHNIGFQEYVSDGKRSLALALTGYSRCPDTTLECSFYFYKSCLEARVYYTENAAKWIAERPERLPDMYRLLNFLSASLWLSYHDGIGGALYSAHHLISPRIYITEDGYHDLTCTMLVDYSILDMAPLEVCDTITASIPALLDKLSTPLFFVLLEKMKVDDAIAYIKKEILKES